MLSALEEPRNGRGMYAVPIATRTLLELVTGKLASGIDTVVFEKRPQSLIVAIEQQDAYYRREWEKPLTRVVEDCPRASGAHDARGK